MIDTIDIIQQFLINLFAVKELPPGLIAQLQMEQIEPQLGYVIDWVSIIWQIVIAIACAAISYVLTPAPDDPTSNSSLEDYDVPTAELGRAIPVLFGRKLVRGPNVVWYGDFMLEDYKK